MSTRIDRAMALSIVERTIAPYVGETLARASTRAQCERLGYLGTTLTADEIEVLLGKLEAGMRVFVGPARATELFATIRGALAAGETP